MAGLAKTRYTSALIQVAPYAQAACFAQTVGRHATVSAGTTPLLLLIRRDDPVARCLMNWLILLLAGLFEVVWAIGLKYTDGFSKPLASALTLAAMATSVILLAWALRTLPVGSAYAVWVGVGAVGTAIASTFLFAENMNPLKALSLGFVVIGIVGLKLAHSE